MGMKSWHVTVLKNHIKVVFEKVYIGAKDSEEARKEKVEEYAAKAEAEPGTTYKVLREWY